MSPLFPQIGGREGYKGSPWSRQLNDLCLIDGGGGGLSSLRGEAGWRRPLKCKGKLGIVAGDI